MGALLGAPFFIFRCTFKRLQMTLGYLFRISSKFHAEIWLIPSFVGIL